MRNKSSRGFRRTWRTEWVWVAMIFFALIVPLVGIITLVASIFLQGDDFRQESPYMFYLEHEHEEMDSLYEETVTTQANLLFGAYPYSMTRRFMVPNFHPENNNLVFDGDGWVPFGRGTNLSITNNRLYAVGGNRLIPQKIYLVENPDHYLRVIDIFLGEVNRLRAEDNIHPLAVLPALQHASIYHARRKAEHQESTGQYWGNPQGTHLTRVVGFMPLENRRQDMAVLHYNGWSTQFPNFDHEEETLLYLAQTVYQNIPLFSNAFIYNAGVYFALAENGWVYISAHFSTDIHPNAPAQLVEIGGNREREEEFFAQEKIARQNVGFHNHPFSPYQLFINHDFRTLSEFNR